MNKTLFAISLAVVATTTIAATKTIFTEENHYTQWYGETTYSNPVAITSTSVPAQAILDVKLVDEETFHAHRFDGTKAPVATSGAATAIIDEEAYFTQQMGITQTEAAMKVSATELESTIGCTIKTNGHCV